MNDDLQFSQPQRRVTPHSDLDYNLMMTDPVVGTSNVNPHLLKQLEKGFYLTDEKGEVLTGEDGKPLYNKDNMWEKLNFYTRDIRLGNLENGELLYCRWYLDFAADVLQENLYEAFIVAFTRAVTVIELSQSKKGFLRRRPNTLRTEHVQGDLEPAPRSLFGGGKKNN